MMFGRFAKDLQTAREWILLKHHPTTTECGGYPADIVCLGRYTVIAYADDNGEPRLDAYRNRALVTALRKARRNPDADIDPDGGETVDLFYFDYLQPYA